MNSCNRVFVQLPPPSFRPPPLFSPFRSLAALITGRYFEDVLIGTEWERIEYSVVAKNVGRIGYCASRREREGEGVSGFHFTIVRNRLNHPLAQKTAFASIILSRHDR